MNQPVQVSCCACLCVVGRSLSTWSSPFLRFVEMMPSPWWSFVGCRSEASVLFVISFFGKGIFFPRHHSLPKKAFSSLAEKSQRKNLLLMAKVPSNLSCSVILWSANKADKACVHLRVCAAVLQLSVCFLGSVSDAVSVTSEGCSSSCFLFDVEMLGCSYSEQTAGAELGHHKESHHAMISTSQNPCKKLWGIIHIQSLIKWLFWLHSSSSCRNRGRKSGGTFTGEKHAF